jgi:hypothetical protein
LPYNQSPEAQRRRKLKRKITLARLPTDKVSQQGRTNALDRLGDRRMDAQTKEPELKKEASRQGAG